MFIITTVDFIYKIVLNKSQLLTNPDNNMGSQQILLILVGVIVVGLMIIAGISFANNYYETSNRDQLVSTLNDLSLLAQQHFKKPEAQGGGGGTYTGFSLPRQFRRTTAGNFSATVRSNRVSFTATGKEIGRNGRTVVRVTARTDKNGIRITIVN